MRKKQAAPARPGADAAENEATCGCIMPTPPGEVKALAPQLAEAAKYIEAVTGSADTPCHFQTFTDCKEHLTPGQPDPLARVLFGSFKEHAPELARLNKAGAGVYFQENEGTGRGKADITRARAVWQDDDRGHGWGPDKPIQPTVEVETSEGKCQRVFVVTDAADLAEHDAVQRRLVADHGCDPGAQGRNRVLRLPGFYHLKNPAAPFLVRIVSAGRAYTWAEIKAAFPPAAAPVNAASTPAEAAGPGNDLTPQEAVALCRGASERFDKLWAGDLLDHPSRSEAEWEVMNALAYATAGDPEKMMDAYRGDCALFEEKCERTCPLYTIPRAIAGRGGSFYQPGVNPFSPVEMEKPPAVALVASGIRAAIKPLADFRAASPPPRTAYLLPWLMAKALVLLAAARGVGKSFFCMGLVEALTTAGSFGPWRCVTPAACLYLDAEMAHADVVERLAGVNPTAAPLYIYSSDLAASLGHPVPNLENPAWRDAMKAVLLDLGIKVFIVDNLSSLTSGDENSKEAWSPINQWLLALRFAGITVILVHHLGKNGSQRGTSGREDNLDCSIILSQPKDYQRENGCRFVCSFTKARVRQRDAHLLREMEFQATVDGSGKTLWQVRDPQRDVELQVVQLLATGRPQKDIAAEVGVNPSTVTRIKKKAIEKGLLGSDLRPVQSAAEDWL